MAISTHIPPIYGSILNYVLSLPGQMGYKLNDIAKKESRQMGWAVW